MQEAGQLNPRTPEFSTLCTLERPAHAFGVDEPNLVLRLKIGIIGQINRLSAGVIRRQRDREIAASALQAENIATAERPIRIEAKTAALDHPPDEQTALHAARKAVI